ncbi:hypothetical protein HRbin01_00710 [archaeon HR01]|nr:hypothetical protein HRbin01_00710 [archaeon HR01]
MNGQELFEIIVNRLAQTESLPSHIQTVGLAVLGILIPLAIAILTELYRKITNPREDFSRLDLHVILNGFFKIKNIIAYTLLIFIPFVFWEFSSGLYRVLLIGVAFVGIILMIKTVWNLYLWVKGHMMPFRYSYLQKISKLADQEIAWESVWKTEGILTLDETNFFKIFSSQIQKYIKNNQPSIASQLLSIFINSLDKRTLSFIVNKDAIEKILSWHSEAWMNTYSIIKGSKSTEWYWIESVLIKGLNKLRLLILEKYQMGLYNFMEIFKNILPTLVQSFSPSDREKYLHYVLDDISRMFLVREGVPENFDIWEFFPKEWQVTKRNLQAENNLLPLLWLQRFYYWASYRLMNFEKDYDVLLDKASANLFPEVDQMKWATILIFVLSPNDEKGKIRSTIERKRTFGYVGRAPKFYPHGEAPSKKRKK